MVTVLPSAGESGLSAFLEPALWAPATAGQSAGVRRGNREHTYQAARPQQRPVLSLPAAMLVRHR